MRKFKHISTILLLLLNTLLFASMHNTPDTTPPTIILNGSSIIHLNIGDIYIDAGALARDNTDGNITANIIIDNQLVNNTLGSYTITYTAFDNAGNKAQVIRTIIVQNDNSHVKNDFTVLTIGDSFTDGADYLKPLVENRC